MSKRSTPPTAEVRPKEITIHGHTRIDNYHWLREKESQDVLDYLQAENDYMLTKTAHTQPLQKTLYQEMVNRIQETDSSAPYRKGSYYYYTRTEAGKQYKIHCRKKGSLDAPEEIILNENELAANTKYFRIGVTVVSPDETMLAYSTDTTGAERYTLAIKNLITGDLLPDRIENTFYAVEWANDNQTLFYTIQDEAWRSHKLFQHTLGQRQSDDVEIFHEPDELFSIWINKTRDNQYLILISHSLETTEGYILNANTPQEAFTLVEPRRHKHRYFVDHRQGTLYILTNENASNHKVMQAPVSTPGQSHWHELIPHDPEKLIESFELFDDFMAVIGRSRALPTLEIYHFQTGETHAVTFPEPVYATRGAENAEAAADQFRFVYTSMTTADMTVDYDVNGRNWTLIKQEPVLGEYDPAQYETELIWATAEDNTSVPISLLYRKGMTRDGSNLCLLYGYGSYGASQSPSFDQKRLSLVDRGFIWAIAHIRGGQEMGRHWYENGKFLHKKNTFTDFIACAEHLITEQYTSRDKLAAMGRSAGGLLMGAVTTMRPDLFKAVVAAVPFVDVVTTMLDKTLPLTIGEWEEWGNPNDKEFYEYMLSYSPYDNTTPQAYPHILITAGLNDPRVQYWEPAKWTAKLRTVKTDDNLLLLKTHMGAGHFSSSGRYDYLKDIAFEYAFLLDVVGN